MFTKHIILFLLFFSINSAVHSQMRSGGKKIKKYTCPIVEAKETHFSLGGKMGDPYGLTTKFYLPKRLGVEMVTGFTFPTLYNEENQRIFEETHALPYDQVKYLGHETTRSYVMQARLIYHFEIQGHAGLDWYIAGGAQWRYFNIHYVFSYENVEPPLADITSIDRKVISAGPEAAIGIEYVLPYSSMSSFAEIGFFLDINNEGMRRKFLGGLGIRYNFNL